MDYSFETYKILLIPSVVVGIGYCLYFIQGRFNERVSKQPYNQLFYFHFLGSQLIVTAIIGLIGYFIRQFMLFMPFCFLVAFWTLNQLYLLTTNRNMILGARWNAPKHKRWSTGLNTFVLIILTFTFSIALALAVGIASVENSSSSIEIYSR
jgi:ABC-type proline/glycine betaine transport system permease subunit